jgi:hypothetical protein
MHVDELIADSLPAKRFVLVAPLRGYHSDLEAFLQAANDAWRS